MKTVTSTLPGIVNAMTVDVEDYFQVAAFDDCIRRDDWDRWPVRVDTNTRRLLALFDRRGIYVTFFVLGWVAERYPALVRAMVSSGHEVASHGMNHERITTLSRGRFRASLVDSKHLLEDLGGEPVKGYRAPSYSIGADTLWAHEELQRAGYHYSSSIVPIHHDLYGMPSAPRFAFRVGDGGLLEIPVTTVDVAGRNWPCGGGGYFRLLPYPVFRRGLRRVNEHERRSGVFYFHPWEIDPGQPRVPGVALRNRVRHYLNLGRTEHRVERLLDDFRFDRMDRVFLSSGIEAYPVVDLTSSSTRACRRERAAC